MVRHPHISHGGSMRALLLSVVALVLMAGPVVADESKRLVTKVFSVADLVTPIPGFEPSQPTPGVPAKQTVVENGEQLVKLVTSMVRPSSWDSAGGKGKAEFFETGCTLVVTNTADAVAEVGDILEALRRLQEISVCTEVRILKLPAGFCEQVGLKTTGDTVLSDRELLKLLEAVQANRDANIMQAPKVTTFDGQSATIRIGETRYFVTSAEAVKVKDATVLVPKNMPVDLGDTLTICGRVSADKKFVSLQAKLTRTTLVGEVEMIPVTTIITPVFEGGSQGKPIPFTQYLEAPRLKSEKVEKTVVLPSGGTVVLGGWKEMAEMKPAAKSMVNKIPYLPRPQKNARPAECEVVVLATTRVLRTEPAPEVAPMPRAVPQVEEKVTAHCLRNASATDVALAISKHLQSKNQKAKLTFEVASNTLVVCAEPVVRNEIEKMIDGLDQAPRQVLLETMVVRVPRGVRESIGLDVNAQSWTLTAREAVMLNALLRAEKQKGTLDVLTRPMIQVCDGQTGNILIGQRPTDAPVPAGGVQFVVSG